MQRTVTVHRCIRTSQHLGWLCLQVSFKWFCVNLTIPPMSFFFSKLGCDSAVLCTVTCTDLCECLRRVIFSTLPFVHASSRPCVHCSRRAQQSDMYLLPWGQGHLCCSPVGPLWEKKCSCSVLTDRDQHKLEICMSISTAKCLAARRSALLVMLCNFAASFDLYYKMCLFLFVHQRTLEAFLLLYFSWFEQALSKFSMTAWIVWRDLGAKQQFACRAMQCCSPLLL